MTDHILYIKENLEVAGETSSSSPKEDATMEAGNTSEIRPTDTFDSSTAGGPTIRKKQDLSDSCASSICWEDLFFQVVYISLFAVLGNTLRIFLGRLFGLDCIYEENGTSVGDFFERAGLCITSDGKGGKGGPVFIDLPANMLGSLLMGIISQRTGPPLPWLSFDHPLQMNSALHVGFTVGFCGCLTTYASWNTQMVVMMDGSDTILGPQIGQALFGYLLGITCCVASFLFGRLFGCCRTANHEGTPHANSFGGTATVGTNDRTHDQSMDMESTTGDHHVLSECCAVSFLLPFLLVLGLLIVFILADAVADLSFYRGVWMSSLLSPIGALLRWRLSTLNRTSDGHWFPWGTFAANVIASVIAVSSDALHSNVADSTSNGLSWISPLLLALEIGFAGSLSTVSTMIRELCSWKEAPWNSVLYFMVTAVLAAGMSLAVYSPVIRAG